MNIELGQMADGELVLVSDAALPGDVKRVEYYRDQRLFMLVYDLADHEGDLMHYELADEVAAKVASKSKLTIVEPDKDTGQPVGYDAFLIQIGA
jgi:hypothetical protein